jgi:3-oxoacyl-[acyl-carrier-protein] synthase II
MGLVTAAGVGVDAAWDHIERGSSCIRPVRSFDTSAFPVALGAEIDQVPQTGRDDDQRSMRLLLAAAGTLTTGLHTVLRRDPEAARRTAVVLGTSKGEIFGMARVHRRFARGIGKLTPSEVEAVRAYRPGHGANRLAEHLGARGPRSTVGLACASSAMAIIHAADLIRSGAVDRAVAGGYDGFSPFIFTGFHVIGALSQVACRPFDRGRDGTVLGEGAALLVLESDEAARARGVSPLAVLEGGGAAGDGVHLTAPDQHGRGLIRAVRHALAMANVRPDEVGYVNAHGTATPFNDAMECEAFRQIFADHGEMPPISSIKSIFGHTLGAAGALDAIVSILAMRRQVLPPTVNGAVDPLVPGWDFVVDHGRPAEDLDLVLTTNSGFAGNNTALVFRLPDDASDPRRAARDTSHASTGSRVDVESRTPHWDGMAP